MLKKFLIIGLLSCTSAVLSAQTSKYSNEFLSLGVSARGMAMSGAMSAITDDAASAYWNPSGLVRNEAWRQVTFMHAEYFAGIAKYDFGALSARIDEQSAAGLSIVRFAVDDIPNTTELIDNDGNINYDKIKSFSAVDFAALFSYARKTPVEGLNGGANLKIIRRKAGDFASCWGFGFDIGAQYMYNDWQFGALIKDATTTYNMWSYTFSDKMKEIFALTGNDIPVSSTEITLPKIIAGAGRYFTIYDKFGLKAAMDLDITSDRKRNVLIRTNPFSIDPHLGLELDYNNIVFLRAGLGNIQRETNPEGKKTTGFQVNMGLGVHINKRFALDYALTDIGNNSIALYSNVFSLRFNINRKEE